MSAPGQRNDGITIRSERRAGDLGGLIAMHGVMYAREHGLDSSFEAYVARAVAEFGAGGPEAGRLWIAELGTRVCGTIAIVRTAQRDIGQLRWFLLAPEVRGLGVGRDLLARAVSYARAENMKSIYLWTFTELHAAIRLYRATGFRDTELKRHVIWGAERTELRMDLDLWNR